MRKKDTVVMRMNPKPPKELWDRVRPMLEDLAIKHSGKAYIVEEGEDLVFSANFPTEFGAQVFESELRDWLKMKN
jgi:hypothetical protein